MNQALKAYMDTRLRENQFIQYIGLELTHIDQSGAAAMVDVSAKPNTSWNSNDWVKENS